MSHTNYYDIAQLCDEIKKFIPNKYYKIKGEISKPNFNNGNVYLNFKGNKSMIPSIIWKNTLQQFKEQIKDGDILKVSGKFNFYSPYGKLSFQINKIHERLGLGENYQQYQELKQKYEKLGYFLEKHKKKPINIIKKIAVLTSTSKSSAALTDFKYPFIQNNINIDIDIINISVQGVKCPDDVSNAINNLSINYDLIVITRGGGGFEDLFGFSSEKVINAIYNSDQIIISAIGHEKDVMLSDLVADIRCPTPSFAAQYIIEHNRSYMTNLSCILDVYKNNILSHIIIYQRKIAELESLLNESSKIYDNLLEEYKTKICINLEKQKIKLDYLLLELESKMDVKYPHIKINDFICSSKKMFEQKWNKHSVIEIVFNDGKVNLNKL